MNKNASQFEFEQQKIDEIYSCFDRTKKLSEKNLKKFREMNQSGTHQNRSERDNLASVYFNRINQLNYVENRLIFGKLTYKDGKSQYIGRIGVSNENGESVLTDWRAPSAQTFYRATLQDNEDVIIRRHIGIENRKVKSIEDEILDFDSPLSKDTIKDDKISGEGTLFTHLSENKTSQMKDILSTIQKEQDEVIRSDADVLVVQGGPGTGKTAVALHRVAYLLYTKKEELEKKGVLIVGPNKSFLHYIDKVIPSLGETGVISTTIPTLLPNVFVSRKESILEKRIKGDKKMVEVIKRAIQDRIHIPEKDINFNFESHTYSITRDFIESTITEILKQNIPHNEGRRKFINATLKYLITKITRAKKGVHNEEQKRMIKMNLLDSSLLKVLLNIIWMPVTKERLIGELWSKPHRLKRIAADLLSDEEISVLTQPVLAPWPASDIPLLDEAYYLLGNIENKHNQKTNDNPNKNDFSEMAEFADYMMDDSYLPKITSEAIKEHLSDDVLFSDIKNRARLDIDWHYGHIVVDEAQELSYMDWRMLKRKCPSQSFTIVGDVSQKSDSPREFTWESFLSTIFNKKVSIEELTVNYRNPNKIASLALNFAKENKLLINQTNCGQEVKDSLIYKTVGNDKITENVIDITCNLLNKNIDENANGRVAVVCDRNRLDQLRKDFYAAPKENLKLIIKGMLASQNELNSSLVFTEPNEVKGLEFDAVVLVEPQDFLDNDYYKFTWLSDLFVAITRPTKQLVILHSKHLPNGLE